MFIVGGLHDIAVLVKQGQEVDELTARRIINKNLPMSFKVGEVLHLEYPDIMNNKIILNINDRVCDHKHIFTRKANRISLEQHV